MKRIKLWLINKILPVWARAELLSQIERLTEKVREQEIEIKQLNAYADGLEAGLRIQRRIVINNHLTTVKPEPAREGASE